MQNRSLKHYIVINLLRVKNNITNYNLPSPKFTSLSEHEPASCFTNLSSLFFASGLLLNVGILLPGNSFSVGLWIRVRLIIIIKKRIRKMEFENSNRCSSSNS